MARNIVGGLIQLINPLNDENASVAKIRDAMMDKHLPYIDETGKKGVQVLCLQEMFNGPYFCPWQFYRDRRPDSYDDMVKQLP